MEERRKIKQRITIEDPEIWEMIEKIRTVPEYSKSLNKVFNEGLKLGLPKLHDKLFPKEAKQEKDLIQGVSSDRDILSGFVVKAGRGNKKLEKSDGKIKSQQELEREEKLCAKFAEYVDSLREILINMIVSKNTNCQVHEMLRRTFNDEPIENEKVLAGYYSDTPKFLRDYEAIAMRNLHKK